MPAGAVTLADITSADWSLMLDGTAAVDGLPTGIGNVVQGVDDVAQCIGIILTTPKGSDYLRPTFGADIWQYIDFPLPAAIPQIVRELYDAISLWEPRVKLISISAVPALDGTDQGISRMIVTVRWQLALSGGALSSPQETTVPILGPTAGGA